MSAHANPNIITDGLVYMYDTGSGKSFKGEPTTNLLSSPTDMEGAGWSLGNTPSQITITGNQSDPFGQNNAILFKVASNGGFYPHIRQIDKITGTTSSHSISIWAKSKSGSTRLDLVCFRSSPWGTAFSKTVTLTSEWQRFELTGTPLDTTGHRVYFMCQNVSSGTATEVYMAYPQLEAKSHATPYVDGTRSSTQGLIDRTGSSTIDLSNVTFDSNSQMSFDGSDDTINTGLFNGRNPSTDPFTIEAIVKSDITSGNRMWIDATTNGSSQRFYSALIDSTSHAIGIQGSAWSDTTPGDTDWHHQVIVMDGNTAKAYNNGELASSKSYTSYTLAGGLNVGGRSGYRWVGQIPIFKIYDQALTQDEVSLNYNAFKDRFGL